VHAGRIRGARVFQLSLPLNPQRWNDLLLALEPSIIEAGMHFIRRGARHM